MATSWKLPLAAAAGEAAEPPPPPPAGPASRLGPVRPRAQPEPLSWDGRGSPRRGGRCQLRGLLGLVVSKLGGREGSPRWPGPVSAGLPRVPERLGPSPGGRARLPRARKSVPCGGDWGAACALGVSSTKPPPTGRPEPAVHRDTGRRVDGLPAARGAQEGSLSLERPYRGPQLLLRAEAGRYTGGPRASGRAAFPGQGPAFSFLRNECSGCAVQSQDSCNRKAELDSQDIR